MQALRYCGAWLCDRTVILQKTNLKEVGNRMELVIAVCLGVWVVVTFAVSCFVLVKLLKNSDKEN